MAVVRAYAPVNLVDPLVWYGEVIYNSSTEIVISDNGYLSATYSGYGFQFRGDSIVGGTLTGFSQEAYWGPQLDAYDFAIPAFLVSFYLEVDDLGGLYSAILSGRDQIYGSNLSDDLAGYDGNDIIYGGLGENYIHGGAGTDMALYDGAIGSYYIDIFSGSIRVSGKNVFLEDTLVSVERLSFSDGVLAFDEGAAQNYRLYQAAFNRTPDKPGLSFWVDHMDDGFSLYAAANHFINSGEFRGLYGPNPSSAEFIDLLYLNVFHRNADEGGYNYWLGEMAQGMTRDQVLVHFSESGENKMNVAHEISSGIWLDSWITV